MLSDLSQFMINAICETVEILVSIRCVHRDLTPRHFMISPSQKVTLIDFGFAVRHGDKTDELQGLRPSIRFTAIHALRVDAGSIMFAPNRLLLRADEVYYASAMDNIETTVKMFYAWLHPAFNNKLESSGQLPAAILKLWEEEETWMTVTWQKLLEEARALVKLGTRTKPMEKPDLAETKRFLRALRTHLLPLSQMRRPAFGPPDKPV